MFTRLVLFALLMLRPASAATLRLIGTNVVDFTAVYQDAKSAATTPPWCWKYLARGVVQTMDQDRVVLRRVRNEYVYNPAFTMRYGDSADVLGMLAARQMGPISPGQYLSMSPQMRMNYEPVTTEVITTVAHCPAFLLDGTPVKVGSDLSVAAWPVGENRFEYGQPVNSTDGYTVITLTSAGFQSKRMATTEEREDVERRVIARQQLQAEKGDGSAQYELGRRYLRGLGVEKNHVLAVQWLSHARTNGYESASDRLLKEAVVQFGTDK